MIVSCDNCGKRYRVHPEKLKAPRGRFKCKRCHHTVKVYKQQGVQDEASSSQSYYRDDYEKRLRQAVFKQLSSSPSSASKKSIAGFNGKKKLNTGSLKILLPGLRGKMMMLFFFFPLVILLAASLLCFRQLQMLTSFVEKESAAIAVSSAEDKIAERCRVVATQTGIYLKSRSNLHPDQFMKNPVFKRIAIQKISPENYTILYQMPDRNGALRVHAHADPALIGKDLREIFRSSFSVDVRDDFSRFVKILMGVRGLKVSKGHYRATDSADNIRDRYMVCTPIEGTPYVILASAFMDEFALPLQRFETQVRRKTSATRRIVLLALLTTMIATGTVVFIYGRRLTRTIAALTDAADRISVGDLAVEIGIKRKDEIGDLANAIGRLQESTRLFLKRVHNQEKN